MPTADFDRLSRDPAFQEMFLSGHRRRVAKGQVILNEGDPPRSLYFIMSGAVAVQLLNWHGHEALLAFLHPGEFFGEMGLFPGIAGRSATITATTDSNLLEVPYPVFIELTRKHKVRFNYVRGHAGHPENERCDTLAREVATQLAAAASAPA